MAHDHIVRLPAALPQDAGAAQRLRAPAHTLRLFPMLGSWLYRPVRYRRSDAPGHGGSPQKRKGSLVARQRPKASHVGPMTKIVMSEHPAGALTAANDPSAEFRDAPSADLAGLVIAAGRRGFSRWRVATALGISASGLASIEARLGLAAREGDLDRSDRGQGQGI